MLADKAYAKRVIGLFKERSKKIVEIAENSGYFFRDPADYDPQAARKYFKNETLSILEALSLKNWPRWNRSAAKPWRDCTARLPKGWGCPPAS